MIKHRYMAAEMYFKVKKERLKQQYFNLDVSRRLCL